jgi:UDP-N-acetyl-alpha-D-muramoyl-L-alanyl-L-glutamate epimerase
VRETFGPVNWYDDPANVPLFRELLGLEDRLPFECIGEADEAALYMRLAVARGYDGAAMTACAERLREPLDPAIARRYLSLDIEGANIPAAIREPLAGLLRRNATGAERLIARLLPGNMVLAE